MTSIVSLNSILISFILSLPLSNINIKMFGAIKILELYTESDTDLQILQKYLFSPINVSDLFR